MSAVLAGPLVDPEAQRPTTSAMVDAALDNATVSSSEAQIRWRAYLEALEAGDDMGSALAALEVASRQARYAWSIYHSAVADARDDWPPAQDATVRHLGTARLSPLQ